MIKNIAIKCRAYPKRQQETLACKTIGCCRKIWNVMLDDKIRHYAETGKMLRNTPAQYKDEYPYLREVDSLALANVQLNLEKAYASFLANPKKFHFPKFKSKKRSRSSYTTNVVNNNNIAVVYANERPYGIKLPKLGIVKAKIHRLPGNDWTLKSATVSQDPDGKWYISLLFEFEMDEPDTVIDPDNAIAFDYKSNGLYMDSSGDFGSGRRFYRESEDRLAKEQKRLSRKKPGSNNYEKQRVKVARVSKHVANQRKDYLHKKSTEIANQYDIAIAEDLGMQLIANRMFHNGKSTYDNGYGMFLDMLKYKQADRGHIFIRIDKWYPSSQLCSCCGARQKMPLSKRTYCCPTCGAEIDRDLNAARNIKAEGLRLLAEAGM